MSIKRIFNRKTIFVWVWVLLSIPYIYMYFVSEHDSKYVDEYNDVFENITGSRLMSGLTVRPPDFSNLYGQYLMIPVYIDRDKHIEMNVYGEYNSTEETELSEAKLALDYELDARWHFILHLEENEFLSIPNDARLYDLSKLILDISFLDHEKWEEIDMRVDEVLSSGYESDIFEVYQIYADVLGYTDINIDVWRDDVFKFNTICAYWYIEIIIFEVYTIILVLTICIKRFKRLRVRLHEKNT